MTKRTDLADQLDEILKEYSNLQSRSQYDDLSDRPDSETLRFITRARAAIRRVAGRRSAYSDQSQEIVQEKSYPGAKATQLVGVLDSLRADLSQGYLQSQRELIHGEVFADFLDMAQHLVEQGYKDAAAVIAGSSLEAHLRRLADRHEVDRVGPNERAKKADRLNSDLAGKEVYSKLDQKSVTAWLDLRNKAAHGHYDDYQANQVELLVSTVRDFITRNPA